ncbi:MAG: hypothetical protein ACTS5A_01405 [Candidatus Hodgkinia cicadicola]
MVNMYPINPTVNTFDGRFYATSQQSSDRILAHFDAEASVLVKSFKTSSDYLSISTLPFSFFSHLPVGGLTLRHLCEPKHTSDGHLTLRFDGVSAAQRALSVLSTHLVGCNLRLSADALHLSLPSLSSSRRTFLHNQLTLTLRRSLKTLKRTREIYIRRLNRSLHSSFDFRFATLNNFGSLTSAASSLISAVYAAAVLRLFPN